MVVAAHLRAHPKPHLSRHFAPGPAPASASASASACLHQFLLAKSCRAIANVRAHREWNIVAQRTPALRSRRCLCRTSPVRASRGHRSTSRSQSPSHPLPRPTPAAFHIEPASPTNASRFPLATGARKDQSDRARHRATNSATAWEPCALPPPCPGAACQPHGARRNYRSLPPRPHRFSFATWLAAQQHRALLRQDVPAPIARHRCAAVTPFPPRGEPLPVGGQVSCRCSGARCAGAGGGMGIFKWEKIRDVDGWHGLRHQAARHYHHGVQLRHRHLGSSSRWVDFHDRRYCEIAEPVFSGIRRKGLPPQR